MCLHAGATKQLHPISSYSSSSDLGLYNWSESDFGTMAQNFQNFAQEIAQRRYMSTSKSKRKEL